MNFAPVVKDIKKLFFKDFSILESYSLKKKSRDVEIVYIRDEEGYKLFEVQKILLEKAFLLLYKFENDVNQLNEFCKEVMERTGKNRHLYFLSRLCKAYLVGMILSSEKSKFLSSKDRSFIWRFLEGQDCANRISLYEFSLVNRVEEIFLESVADIVKKLEQLGKIERTGGEPPHFEIKIVLNGLTKTIKNVDFFKEFVFNTEFMSLKTADEIVQIMGMYFPDSTNSDEKFRKVLELYRLIHKREDTLYKICMHVISHTDSHDS